MESMRGWLAAFAVAAAILVAISLQWRPTEVMSDFDHDNDELITQNPIEYLFNDIPEIGSSGKDYSHADE